MFWLIVTNIAVAFVAYRLGVRDGKLDKNEFKYVCFHEGCTFKASSNRMNILMAIADSHSDSHG